MKGADCDNPMDSNDTLYIPLASYGSACHARHNALHHSCCDMHRLVN